MPSGDPHSAPLPNPADVAPVMSDRSGIFTADQARSLAGALPARFRMHSWHLLYRCAAS